MKNTIIITCFCAFFVGNVDAAFQNNILRPLTLGGGVFKRFTSIRTIIGSMKNLRSANLALNERFGTRTYEIWKIYNEPIVHITDYRQLCEAFGMQEKISENIDSMRCAIDKKLALSNDMTTWLTSKKTGKVSDVLINFLNKYGLREVKWNDFLRSICGKHYTDFPQKNKTQFHVPVKDALLERSIEKLLKGDNLSACSCEKILRYILGDVEVSDIVLRQTGYVYSDTLHYDFSVLANKAGDSFVQDVINFSIEASLDGRVTKVNTMFLEKDFEEIVPILFWGE